MCLCTCRERILFAIQMSAQASRRRCLLGRGRAFDASVLEFSSSINALEAGFLKRLCKLRIHNWEWRPLWTALLRVSPLWTLQRASIRTDRVNDVCRPLSILAVHTNLPGSRASSAEPRGTGTSQDTGGERVVLAGLMPTLRLPWTRFWN